MFYNPVVCFHIESTHAKSTVDSEVYFTLSKHTFTAMYVSQSLLLAWNIPSSAIDMCYDPMIWCAIQSN